MQFYVLAAGETEPKGPFDVATIQDQISKGWLNGEARAARPGSPDWFPLAQVPEFAIALRGGAPPTPKTPTGSKNVGGLVALVVVAVVALFWSLGGEKEAPAKPDVAPPSPPAVEAAPATAYPTLPSNQATIREVFEKMEFAFEDSTPVDGKPRVQGKHGNGLSFVELIGRNGDTESASLMLGLEESAALINAGSLMVLMRETGWPDGHKWALDVLTSKGEAKKVHRGVLYSVNNLESLGIATVSAKPSPR